MRFKRKVLICAVFAGIGLGAGTAYAQQRVCQHVGKWSLVGGVFVCKGDYADGHCVWTDDCRMNVE